MSTIDLSQALSDAGLPNLSVGGSQVASVVGVGFQSHLELYADLVNGKAEKEPNAAMEWGTRLEPSVAKKYEDNHAEDGLFYISGERQLHPVDRWVRATADRLAFRRLTEAPERGVEIKTAGHHMSEKWGPEGSQDVPLGYVAQVSWYQRFFDLDRWDLAVLIGGSDYREFQIPRDKGLEDILFEECRRFLIENVIPRKPPEPDGTEESAKALARIFPKERDADVLVPTPGTAEYEAWSEMIQELHASQIEFDLAEDELTLAKNNLRLKLADTPGVKTPYGSISWKKSKDGQATDWEGLAKALLPFPSPDVSKLMLEKYTKPKPGPRVFLATYPK